MTEKLCLECIEAEEKSGLDISFLLKRLTSIKGNKLSYNETIYFCLSLCGYTNCQIAYKLYNHKLPSVEELQLCKEIKRLERNMKSEMSDRVNAYIKQLMNLDFDRRKPSWLQVINFLKDNGYEKGQSIERNTRKRNLKYFIISEGSETSEENIKEKLRQLGMYNVVVIRKSI